MEYGPTKTALMEEAVRMADTLGDIELAYKIREDLITAASFGGQPDLAIVHFSWCLSQFDRNPDHDDEHNLLWKYKWIVSRLPNFPQIPRQEIERMLDDMERRYRAHGSSLHAVYNERRSVAMDMGDVEAAKRAHTRLQKTRRDHLADCAACVANKLICYYRFRNQHRRAVQEGSSLIQRNLRCTEVPAVTFGRLLIPLLKLKRPEEAMRYHQMGYRLNTRNPGRLGALLRHLEFLALTDNFAEAVRAIQKHLPVALTSTDPDDHFEFFRVAWLVFDRLHESGKDSIKLRMPADFALAQEEGKYQTDLLAKSFHDQAHALALRFDARNGNDFYRRKLDDTKKLKKYAIAMPIPRQK